MNSEEEIYYYLLYSQESFLNDLVLEEIFRERTNFYLSQNKQIDFWIVDFFPFSDSKSSNSLRLNNKFFYKNINYLANSDINNNFYFIIYSKEKLFIDWLILRFGESQTDLRTISAPFFGSSKINRNKNNIANLKNNIFHYNIESLKIKFSLNKIFKKSYFKTVNRFLIQNLSFLLNK
jgi:hypothetical protein